MRKGDILILNCFLMISGYYTALERTLFLDHAGDRSLELWEVNVKVHRRGLESIRPGARCCDIAGALNEIYREHDIPIVHEDGAENITRFPFGPEHNIVAGRGSRRIV